MSSPSTQSLAPSHDSKSKSDTRYLDTTAAYDLWSQVYDTDGNFLQALDTIEMRSLLPRMLSQISVSKPWKIVDLGCGTGRNTLPLLDIPYSTIVGVDASPRMLDFARSNINARMAATTELTKGAKEARLELYDVMSNTNIPENILNADAVISTLVLEHIPLFEFFQAASNMLKPGGLVLVTNMHPEMGGISQAGFLDPKTGEKVRTQSIVHRVEDVIAEAQRQGFRVLGDAIERRVDEDMSKILGIRARKWVGVTVWFGVCFRKNPSA